MGTKEKILLISLGLFSQKGYAAVSVREIAEELHMTKGALYRHYKNKQDIFESIVKRMEAIDRQRAKEFAMPEEKYEQAPAAYESISMDSVENFTMEQFRFWTTDNFAANFRRMLTLEQYRDPNMAKLYRDCLSEGPFAYMEDLFREMIRCGVLRSGDPREMALEFYSPMYLLMSIADSSKDKKNPEMLLEAHIKRFMKKYVAS